jgi:hypothetical protein
MRELRLKTGQVVTEEAYREMHPRTSFANGQYFTPASDADLVEEVAPPTVTETERVERDGIELVNGRYVQKWKVVSLDPSTVGEQLKAARAAKTKEIDADWLGANNNFFYYQDKKIAADMIAQQSINGTNGYIALFGEFQRDWPGGWKTMDNDYVTIGTIEEWKDFYRSMVDQGQLNFAYAQQLKQKAATAQTLEELNAIKWGKTAFEREVPEDATFYN